MLAKSRTFNDSLTNWTAAFWTINSVEEYRPSLGGARLEAPCAGEVRGAPAVFVAYWVWDRSLGRNLQRAGVVALGAGLWLMLRRPTPEPPPAAARARVRPVVGARGVGLGVEGSW